MSDRKRESERREFASRDGSKRRMVKLPGESRHEGSSESAALIAKRIALRKLERRTKRGSNA